MLILGQIFSFLGASCIAYSIFCKNKKNMIVLQLCTNLFCTITNVFLKGYPGIIANFLLTTRHFLELKGKLNKINTTLICVLLITFGLYFNNKGIIGILPIASSVIFVIFTYLVTSVQNMRIVIGTTVAMWAFYDFYIKSYPLFVMDIINVVISFTKFFQVACKTNKDKQIKASN